MNYSNLLLRTTLTLTTLAALGCQPQAAQSDLVASQASASSGSAAVFGNLQQQATWNGGYCANVVVKNSGSAASKSWSLVVKANGVRFTKWWNVSTAVSGDLVTITPNATWNSQLAPGASSAAQGFCADLPSGAKKASIQSSNGQAASPSPSAPGSSNYPTCTNGSDTGNGFGWDPSVTDPAGSHSCLAAKLKNAVITNISDKISLDSDDSLPSVDLGAPGNSAYQLHDYGQQLQTNKNALGAACDAAGATAAQKAVIIAIAMQETTLMGVWQRDDSKDRDASANASILNLNYDMLTKLGYNRNDYGTYLNDISHLTEAVSYMLKAFQSWGVPATLNYHRGGYTGFRDGSSYGVYGYRNAIETMYKLMRADPALMHDGRRIEINVPHV